MSGLPPDVHAMLAAASVSHRDIAFEAEYVHRDGVWHATVPLEELIALAAPSAARVVTLVEKSGAALLVVKAPAAPSRRAKLRHFEARRCEIVRGRVHAEGWWFTYTGPDSSRRRSYTSERESYVWPMGRVQQIRWLEP